MISWMQKHNKYLVWTIWVATIAFIGAGFVGWGSYSFGSKASNVAKVGNIEISRNKLNMVYSEIYNQYNQALRGTLDEKKAKELGLIKQAFSKIATQAKVLNLAQEFGIIVSDKEILSNLENIKSFQKDGKFNREFYNRYLSSQRLKAKTFEENLREQLIIQKTLSLLSTKALPFEKKVIGSALNVSDKIAYRVLTLNDVNITINDKKLKSFWDMRKNDYMNKQKYKLSIIWTSTKDVNLTENEIKSYYDANSFNYIDKNGKSLLYSDAKAKVIKDLKLKKKKRSAQKAYIAFKKGKLSKDEEIIVSIDDLKFTKKVWDSIKEKSIGDIIKPKIVGDRYATIKIDNIIMPKVKTFNEAKNEVTKQYLIQAKKEALLKLANKEEKEFNKSKATISDFIKISQNIKLNQLSSKESLQFLEKLFTSTKEKGIISISDKIIIYDILAQKIAPIDANQTEIIDMTTNRLKETIFESNLIKMLDKKYPTKVYIGGLTN